MAVSKHWSDNLPSPNRLDGTAEQEKTEMEAFLNAIPPEMMAEAMSDKYAYLDEGLDEE